MYALSATSLYVLSSKWNKINSGQQRTLLQGLSHSKKVFLRSLIFFHSSRFWKHTHIHTYIISVTMFRYIQVELSSEWKMIFFSCIGKRQREEELIRTFFSPSSSALLEVTNCFRMWEVLRKEKKVSKKNKH